MSSKRDDKGKGKYRKPYTPNACVKFSDCGYTCIEAIKFVWHNILRKGKPAEISATNLDI